MIHRPPSWVIGMLAMGCLLAMIACQQQPADTPRGKPKAIDSGVIVVRVRGDKEGEKKDDPAWDLPPTAPTLKSTASKAFAERSLAPGATRRTPSK